MERTLRDMLADAAQLDADGRTDLLVGSNWSQGRTTFGGLGASLALQAMRTRVAEDRPLRSLLCTFAAPIPVGDTVTLEVETLREGGSATSMAARMLSEGQTATAVQATFGLQRPAKAAPAQEAPDMPDADQVPIVPPMPGFPGFLTSLDVKWVGNGIPTAAAADRRLQAFVRLRDRDGIGRAEEIVTLADMPPPIMMSHYGQRINAATMSWSLDFVRPAREVEGDWLYLDYRLIAARDGYSQQSGRIHDQAGRLVAVSHQTMAYFDPK